MKVELFRCSICGFNFPNQSLLYSHPCEFPKPAKSANPAYNYEISKESIDCDGPMYYQRQEKNDVSHDELHRALGQFTLGYQHIAYGESQSPGCIVLHGYSKTDEGSDSGSFVFWEVI